MNEWAFIVDKNYFAMETVCFKCEENIISLDRKKNSFFWFLYPKQMKSNYFL